MYQLNGTIVGVSKAVRDEKEHFVYHVLVRSVDGSADLVKLADPSHKVVGTKEGAAVSWAVRAYAYKGRNGDAILGMQLLGVGGGPGAAARGKPDV